MLVGLAVAATLLITPPAAAYAVGAVDPNPNNNDPNNNGDSNGSNNSGGENDGGGNDSSSGVSSDVSS
jgi:hypothetical protein